MKHRILFSRREGFDITYAATCEFEAKAPDDTHANSFMILSDAVTRWVKETDEGKEMWGYSSRDANIGDLATMCPEGALEPYGIKGLALHLFSGDEFANYDAHLVDWDDEEEIPAPGVPVWTAEDAKAAAAEGWGLFDVDSSGYLEIQRFDEEEMFDSDDEALAYVRQRVAQLGAIHYKALKIHEANAPFLVRMRAFVAQMKEEG